jgi:hypothetical protein
MLELLEKMVVEFLGVVPAAYLSFLDGERLDQWALPSGGGDKRLAGVDLNKARMRAVAEAVLALGAAPRGFSARDLAEKVHDQVGRTMSGYHPRQAAYDLRKLRGKSLVERIPKTRRSRPQKPGIRKLAGCLVIREKVIHPVLAGVCRRKPGRPPKLTNPLDMHYENLQKEMFATLKFLKLAA